MSHVWKADTSELIVIYIFNDRLQAKAFEIIGATPDGKACKRITALLEDS
jgi:hypothetical protein